jgi:hypothetical protein
MQEAPSDCTRPSEVVHHQVWFDINFMISFSVSSKDSRLVVPVGETP